MAFRRKGYKRRGRRYGRSRRPRRRTARKSFSDANIHRFTRTSCFFGAAGKLASTYFGPPTTAGSGQEYNLYFSLNQVNNYGNFTGLFDQYRIRKIKLDYIPVLATQSIAQVSSSIETGTIITAFDPDNVLALGQAPYDYTMVKEHAMTRRFTVSCAPRPAIASYKGAFTAYASPRNTLWMDCQYPDVQYYGIRHWFPELTGSSVTGYRVTCKFWLEFKYTV